MTKLPEPIANREQELSALVTTYPVNIPIAALAEFLDMNAECLRRCISNGNCPFALGWQKNAGGNKAFYVSTYTFFQWYTRGVYQS